LASYVARRVGLAVLVLAGVLVLTFTIAHVVPGDPAATWAGPHASAAQVAAARQFLGLDRPLPVQLASYVAGIVTGNWGVSIHTHRPVLSDLATVAPASLELVIAAMIIGLAVGVPLGLVSARWPGGLVDQAIRSSGWRSSSSWCSHSGCICCLPQASTLPACSSVIPWRSTPGSACSTR
jgi:peptide/nickel transport system permease protein